MDTEYSQLLENSQYTHYSNSEKGNSSMCFFYRDSTSHPPRNKTNVKNFPGFECERVKTIKKKAPCSVSCRYGFIAGLTLFTIVIPLIMLAMSPSIGYDFWLAVLYGAFFSCAIILMFAFL